MTDSKTATERLREMLDARGVEWYEPPTKPNKTWFPDENGINCCARPWSDALEIRRHGLTPEQAIAATLGSGKCELESSYYYDDYDQYEFEFSCGYSVKMYDKEPPNYCPNCGRRVVNNDN